MKRKALMITLLILLMVACCSCGEGDMEKRSAGMNIRVDESNGSMTITRPEIKNPAPMGDKDTWTIFVYLCGSDLESRFLFGGGMGTDDIKEMCAATSINKVRFVIETGGSDRWHNKMISSDAIGRFVVENGRLKEVGEEEQTSMGKSSTLKSFLQWGIKKYPAEKMGVVFWDHGGGSITGVCFDEIEDNDSLSLREIDAAMLSVLESGELTDKFEFIGFDACLMGTVEAANISASYADYMIASQESEPGSGWDYTAIGNYLAKHPDSDGKALGKTVCDSFKKQCESIDDVQIATMSVTDLSQMDSLLKDFNALSKEIYSKSEDRDVLASLVRKINDVDNFGGNNRAEGYTNMVDLGGIIKACKKWSDKSGAATESLSDAVVYSISGSDHQGASGLSIYYPLQVEGSKELSIFESVCISPYYMSFVGRQGYGSANDGDYEEYDEEELFEGGFWDWLDVFLFDDEDGDYDYEYDYDDGGGFWSFLDDYEEDAESELITFSKEPDINKSGEYCFTLDAEGLENTADVLALVYQDMNDGTFIELGETYDVNVDWETGYVSDYFDGYWLSLPDGQNLATYIVDVTDDYVIYTSPILLNGEEAYLRMRQYYDSGVVKVEGVWEGIDDYGAADKSMIKLQSGDSITPTYFSVDDEGYDMDGYEGEAYKVKSKNGDLRIGYDYLFEGDYEYSFCITDIFGDDYITDPVTFNLDEYGNVSFY